MRLALSTNLSRNGASKDSGFHTNIARARSFIPVTGTKRTPCIPAFDMVDGSNANPHPLDTMTIILSQLRVR